MKFLFGPLCIVLAVLTDFTHPTCVLESDFGFKINCAFKKSGLFRVRNLGGIKAHASLGFSLGDELGFEQSLTNLDPSRRRSVNVRNGVPPNLISDSTTRPAAKQEKRGKQNRIMMRPVPSSSRPNHAAMDKLSSLHRRVSTTMQPIIVPSVEAPSAPPKAPTITLAKPIPMGVPAFKPLPPKEETLKVVPLTSTAKNSFTPLQLSSKGPGLVYQSENYPQSHNQVSKMVSQMTAVQYAQPLLRITPTPIIINTPKLYPLPTTVNPFIPMPLAAPPTQAISIISGPVFKDSIHARPQYQPVKTIKIQTNPISNFIDPAPQQVNDLAYPANTKKIDEYNSISGYSDDTALKFDKEDINSRIVEIAKAGNISMEAVEAAIALRQQQLLTKYANMPTPTSTTTTTTTTTEEPLVFQQQPEPEILVATPQKPKRNPTIGKVMNAPKEYYPVGYEKNFDDHFQTKVDLPDTDFHCGDQKYFPGLYGDESLGCMVFHVCALTDEGLVMKSFLCPESTLFDQTILKCNWWFYVDCRSSQRLYDTNIPVSKSYQLMKALTFFSSYKKEMQDAEKQTNPEDVAGIKEAISILENQDNSNSVQTNGVDSVQVITPQPLIDERNVRRTVSTDRSPVYRANRNYNSLNNTRRSTPKNRNSSSEESSSEIKLVTVNADINVNRNGRTNSRENQTSSESSERKHRRRMTLKNTPNRFNETITTSTTTTSTSTPEAIETGASSIEIVKQDIQPLESFLSSDVKQQKLEDELNEPPATDSLNTAPIKRFYRSSAEKDSKEVAFVNNEKVQIVRPTSSAKLVGDFQTPTAVIAKLDEAILGSNPRFKKSAVTIVTPVNHEDYRIHTEDQT